MEARALKAEMNVDEGKSCPARSSFIAIMNGLSTATDVPSDAVAACQLRRRPAGARRPDP